MTGVYISAGALVVAICSLIASVFRNGKNDSKEDATSQAMIVTKLESISQCINEVRSDVKAIQKDLQNHEVRLATIEQKVKGLEKEVFK